MKKGALFITTSFLLTMWANSLFAASVTPEQVKTAAETFISLRYPAPTKADARTTTAAGISPLAVASVETWKEGETIVGFIAHLNPSGYVLMRADDTAPPLKLYNEQGDFADLPPDFLKILQWELAQELKIVKQNQIGNGVLGSNTGFQAQWKLLLNPIKNNQSLNGFSHPALSAGPLSTVSWEQQSPYNRYTPMACEMVWKILPYPHRECSDSGYAHAPVGCVAIAMAQIMRYHRWPVRINGNPSYTDNQDDSQGTYTAGCAAGVTNCGNSLLNDYDWGNMPGSTSEIDTPAEKKAIGQLVYHTGVSVQMNYEYSESAASSSNVPNALRNNFSYTCTNLESRPSDLQTWYNRIDSDITHSRPVYYRFCDNQGRGCHAVVVTGTRNGNEIYINMGWGNMKNSHGNGTNTWYNMENVHVSIPGSDNDYNFNDGHRAIFQITPNNGFNPNPNPNPNPSDPCGCNGSNPTLNCMISGAYSCTGHGSIRLVPNFHAQQGSNVTLKP